MGKRFNETKKIDIIVAAKNGLSCEDIAKGCDVSNMTAYRYKKFVDSTKNLTAIANTYHVNYHRLYTALRKSEYQGVRSKRKPIVEEPRYTWKEVVEIIYNKYNILLGD